MLSKDDVAKLEAQYGDVAHVVGPLDDGKPRWELVIRRPTRQEYRFYKVNLKSERTAVDANGILLGQIAVYPSGPELDKMLDTYWAIPDSKPVQDALAYFGGLESDKLGK